MNISHTLITRTQPSCDSLVITGHVSWQRKRKNNLLLNVCDIVYKLIFFKEQYHHNSGVINVR